MRKCFGRCGETVNEYPTAQINQTNCQRWTGLHYWCPYYTILDCALHYKKGKLNY